MFEFKLGLIIRDIFGIYWILTLDRDAMVSNHYNLSRRAFYLNSTDTIGTDIFCETYIFIDTL